MMMTTLFFDIPTNLVSDAFLGERGGGDFNDDKKEDREDNNDEDDKDKNNGNKVDVWAGALRWVSADGGGGTKPNVVRCLPGRGER